jgi:hypothetical protein
VRGGALEYPAAGCRSGWRRPTHFPIVRGSAINGPGWSAGNARNPFQIIELEVVAKDGIEPSTREYSVQLRPQFGASKSKSLNESSQSRPN